MRGKKGVPECTAFHQQFMANAAALPVIISVQDFDQFAASNGYYSLRHEPDTVLGLRNRLRNKINNTATSEVWIGSGNNAFQIQVSKHGVTYIILGGNDAFNHRTEKLPRAMESIVKTKHRAVKLIRASITYENLPDGIQLRIDMLDEELDAYKENLLHATNQFNKKLMRVGQNVSRVINRSGNNDSSIKQLLLDLETPLEGEPEIDPNDVEDDEEDDENDTTPTF